MAEPVPVTNRIPASSPDSSDDRPSAGAIRRLRRRRLTFVGVLLLLGTAVGIGLPKWLNRDGASPSAGSQAMAGLEDKGSRVVLRGRAVDGVLWATVEHYYQNPERDVMFQTSVGNQLGLADGAFTILVVTLSVPPPEPAQSQPDEDGDEDGDRPEDDPPVRFDLGSLAVSLELADGTGTRTVTSRTLRDIARQNSGQARVLINGFNPPVSLGTGESVRVYLAFPGPVDLRTTAGGELRPNGADAFALAPETETYTTPPGLREPDQRSD